MWLTLIMALETAHVSSGGEFTDLLETYRVTAEAVGLQIPIAHNIKIPFAQQAGVNNTMKRGLGGTPRPSAVALGG
jgi:hypothetical protein